MDKNSVDSDTDSVIADERKALEISILEDWYGGYLEENRYVDQGAGWVEDENGGEEKGIPVQNLTKDV